MDTTWFAVLLSLVSALVGAVGTVLQQTEAAAAHQRGLRLLRAMITRPRWLLGYGLGVLAVGLSAWRSAPASCSGSRLHCPRRRSPSAPTAGWILWR